MPHKKKSKELVIKADWDADFNELYLKHSYSFEVNPSPNVCPLGAKIYKFLGKKDLKGIEIIVRKP